MRPLFAPLLHRFHWRIQSAVRDALSASDTGYGGKLESIRLRLDVLQIGMDAARLDAASAQQSLGEQIERLRAELAAVRDAQRVGDQPDGLGPLMSKADLLLQRAAIPLGPDLLVRTPEGYLVVPAEDPALLAALYEGGGVLEVGTTRVLKTVLRPGDVSVDVGAHIGLTVIPAAKVVGENGRVIAIEPGSRVGSLLSRNIALNGLSERVTMHRCAAGSETGTANLNVGVILAHSSLLPLETAKGVEQVEVRRVDELVEPGCSVRLAKLDAEGFELQVWQGMRRVIEESPDLAVIVELGSAHLARAGIGIDDWLSIFRASGFVAYEIEEDSGAIRRLRSSCELTDIVSVNLLLLRQSPEAFPGLVFS